MNVFDLRDQVIDEYKGYVRGFVRVKEPRAQAVVDHYFESGRLWPEPLLQLNPAFEPGRSVDDLVKAGELHQDCGRIFRRRADASDVLGQPINLYRHQDEAIQRARSGKSYVLTTGTGSGKSLAYFVPIVDHVLRAGRSKGVTAVVVYPMNALCNSQLEALTRYLTWAYPGGEPPVRFARYTGQEGAEARDQILRDPPDILLTNFMMLELILTRTTERQLVQAFQGLEFLVLDELHTYRGRQGADVAMLVRRVRERCGAATMRCVGTSATLAGAGTWEQRQQHVAQVASSLFGDTVPAENVIGETLRTATRTGAILPTDDALRQAVEQAQDLPSAYADLADHPLAVWAETAFGLERAASGRLERRQPRTVGNVAQDLATQTGLPPDTCQQALQRLLMAGFAATHPTTGQPLFAFRLHQFISRGDTLYATPEPPARRHLTTEKQTHADDAKSRALYPLAFCRECGQDYMVVRLDTDKKQLHPCELEDAKTQEDGDDGTPGVGFLVLDGPELPDLTDPESLPEHWMELFHGTLRVTTNYRSQVPRRITVRPDGQVEDGSDMKGGNAWFLPAPFQYCPGCGVTYLSTREGAFARLSELSSGGRSTATTILSLALVRALRADASVPAAARKLLSFTDNRQDASLQAGHFNDFVLVTLLRTAILAAVQRAGPDGLSHDRVAQEVASALDLDFAEYASNAEAMFGAKRATMEALREVIGYRVYHDLRRGWRVVSPNLEAVGLLRIAYLDLDDLCAEESLWNGCHPVLAQASASARAQVATVLLDVMRRGLAIKVGYLDGLHLDSVRQQSNQFLRPPWAIDENEDLNLATLATSGGIRGAASQAYLSVGPRSQLGRYISRASTWPSLPSGSKRLNQAETGMVIDQLLSRLTLAGLVERAAEDQAGYRLQAGQMRWVLGDGTPAIDHTRIVRPSSEERQGHAFFTALYQVGAQALHGMQAREHTAQVPSQQRQEREALFRTGTLPVLYCSPTMELGVDIADLSSVLLRNAPPTPANYAQRSGRAGRSGQPALVLTYCTTYSPHDQHYFRRPVALVAGAVAPPRLDLANEDLVRAHVHAIWLAETGQSLGSSVAELINLADESLSLTDSLRAYLYQPSYLASAVQRARGVLQAVAAELTPERAPWYTDSWLTETVKQAPAALDQAVEHWRSLYRSASQQRDAQHATVSDPTTSASARDQAQRLRSEAETQLSLLTSQHQDVSSDYYSYRYFATQGFLPGYNFPRLPVTAYIPGRRLRGGDEEYLNRARFVALSEFGPGAIVYHEGSRYQVTRIVIERRQRSDQAGDFDDGATTSAAWCTHCGYGHFGAQRLVDRCQGCNSVLNADNRTQLSNLLPMQVVSTRRVDRITCDEEERMRQGFEINTMYRFAERHGAQDVVRASISSQDEHIASATYGASTTIWKVNAGWRRRKNKEQLGFFLDMDRGIWSRKENEPTRAGDDAPGRPAAIKRVLPFVEDHRNALLLEFAVDIKTSALLSLQYALKHGIETLYQLEESELAVEPLPSAGSPRSILLYEASEGGAGVLTRLVREPRALAQVARTALELCHFDPDTGADLGRAPGAQEDCHAACYDCLLSYSNQRVHELLDRKNAAPVLFQLATATAVVGAGGRSRDDQLERLLFMCESDLERDFLRWLFAHGYRLPDRAQAQVAGLPNHIDFVYEGDLVAVSVDGYPHSFDPQREKDKALDSALLCAGWTSVRVGGADTWAAQIAAHSYLFGEGKPS